MTTTLSPMSTCGVNVGLCFPRRRIATSVASRPTTRFSASIRTHFFSTSAGFAEKVFMIVLLGGLSDERQNATGKPRRAVAGQIESGDHAVKRPCTYIRQKSDWKTVA